MTDIRQYQVFDNFLRVLTSGIGKYTSPGFAVILVSKNIMRLRDEYDCFNSIIINENRYSEGLNALTVSEDINEIDPYQFYSGIKALIEKTLEGFETNADIEFLNNLHEKIPDIFYAIKNLDKIKKENIQKGIMIVDDDYDTIETVKNGIHQISKKYMITGANSGVQCFDLLTGDYKPQLIILNILMSEKKGWEIFERIKRNSSWKDIPIILMTSENDEYSNIYCKDHMQECIVKPFEINDLKLSIDAILNG